MPNVSPAPTPTSVYQYFDVAGRLLYVGVTARGHKRAEEHAKSKTWWPLVASSKITHFTTREDALREESFLIRTRHPMHNIQQNGRAPIYRVGLSPSVRLQPDHVRPLMGRLSRVQSLDDIDTSRLIEGMSESANLVLAVIETARAAGDDVPALRARLRQLGETNEDQVLRTG